MRKFISGLIIIFVSPLVLAQAESSAQLCIAAPLSASYQITAYDKENQSTSTQQLVLWRYQGRVAHQYPKSGITDIWRHQNHRLGLERMFHRQERGIEYFPGEIKDNNWPSKYQLIDHNLVTSSKPVSTTGEGCDYTETYLATKNQKLTLEWLPKQNLVKQARIESARYSISWKLLLTETDALKIKRFFDQLSSYQMTDYTDIGDNESDPFLRKMINLGFIEHSASGFYDANGYQLDHHH